MTLSRSGAFLPSMSTLVQIESAVADLPPQDQRSLLSWLQARLRFAPNPQAPVLSDRQVWLGELAELQARTHTGKSGVPLQELMDDLREERC